MAADGPRPSSTHPVADGAGTVPLRALGWDAAARRHHRGRPARRALRRHPGRVRPRGGAGPAARRAACAANGWRAGFAGLNELLRPAGPGARGAAVALSARRRPGRRSRRSSTTSSTPSVARSNATSPEWRATRRQHDEQLRRWRPTSPRERQEQLDAAARRRRRPDPRPVRLRLHGPGRARSASTSCSIELRKQVLDAQFAGMSDALKGMTPGRPGRQPRHGPRAQRRCSRSAWRATSRTCPTSCRATAASSRGRDARRHHRAARGAHGPDAVADAVAQRRAAPGAAGHDGCAAPDDRLRWDLAQLAATLDALLPEGLGQRFDFQGGEQLSLAGCAAQLGRLNRDGPACAPDGRDRDARRSGQHRSGRDCASCSTPSPRPTCAALQELAQAYSRRRATPSATGKRLELTPRGARRLGQGVLDELFGEADAATSSAATPTAPRAPSASATRAAGPTSSAGRSILICRAPWPMP